MACGARLGLKQNYQDNSQHQQSRLNGLWSPFGFAGQKHPRENLVGVLSFMEIFTSGHGGQSRQQVTRSWARGFALCTYMLCLIHSGRVYCKGEISDGSDELRG